MKNLWLQRGYDSSIPGARQSESRRRWMLYPVYISAVVVFLLTIDLFWSMDEMRAFLGDKGIQYCWKYGNFHRYFYTNLALTCVDVVVLLYLYRLARHDRLFAYLIVWAVFLFGEPILSFFDLSYC